MQVVRVYTGDDGESHFEELELPYEKIADAERTAIQSATGIQFRRVPSGNFQDFHVAPRRQYVITLQGQAEIGLGDGTKRIFNAGDVLLADDLTDRGHTTAAVGNGPRVSIAIPLID
jgi:quercetin dioxygenase-like cupin family protein